MTRPGTPDEIRSASTDRKAHFRPSSGWARGKQMGFALVDAANRTHNRMRNGEKYPATYLTIVECVKGLR